MISDDPGLRKGQLDELVVTIELTLVSLAQSLALATLATAAIQPLIHLNWQYWPYIASGFILILFFWTQAISHALTFINWPINMAHNVIYHRIQSTPTLVGGEWPTSPKGDAKRTGRSPSTTGLPVGIYFVAMMVEVVLFTQISDPVRFFVVNALFYGVGAVFYTVDLAMIRKREADFTRAGQEKLYGQLVHDQQLALRVLIPFGILFSIISALAITAFPALFIDHHAHVWLGLMQTAVGLLILVRSIRDFRTHATLLTGAQR